MSIRAIPMPVRIIVMAKAPRAGQAKTRLIPALGAEGAAALARRLLHHTLCEALAAAESLKHAQMDATVTLCGTPLSPRPASGEHLWGLPELTNWLPRLHLQDQGTGDLGARMARAVQVPLAHGEACVLVGTDCPALGREALHGIVLDLQQHDAVMVPATDGGYVALGLRRFAPTLFTDMPWSTAHVAELTRQRLRATGLILHERPPEHDIDEPADLLHLPNDWLSEAR